jgi:aminoglycoside phosphotransferase (APT) family kinase protein
MASDWKRSLGPIDKDRPSPEWIAALRHRFPVEREVDRVLTRKLERRAGPGYAPLPLSALVAGTESLLRARVGGDFRIDDARWLSGGASKLQVAFTLDWSRPGRGRERTPLVLRMQPAESIVETSRLREFQVLAAMDGVVPVPPVFWCDADGEHLPYPGLVYGFVAGVTKPSTGSGGVSGVGTSLPPEFRERLAPQFIEHLARIHRRDLAGADLGAFDVPEPGTTQAAEWSLAWWERVWEEDGDEDVPLLRLAAAWLRRRLPVLDRPSIVHADYRIGNFLFTEEDARISAWLDWELARLGDPHLDVAWTMSHAWSGLHEDGKTRLVSGMVPEPEFLESYERASGRRVDPRTLDWYKVFDAYSLAVLLIGTSFRIARNEKTHHDVLVAWVVGLGSLVLEQLRGELERKG